MTAPVRTQGRADRQAAPGTRRGAGPQGSGGPQGGRRRGAVLLASALALAACAQAPADPAARAEFETNNDPAEPTNRAVFQANQFVDRNALKPVARGYAEYVPGRVRHSLHSFVSNLEEPVIAINDLLQGNTSRAWNTTQRFAVNTTLGGAGLFDVATDWDRPRHDADFGQTLGVWGVEPGPAVQLPLFGPSNLRDTAGKVAGAFLNPLALVGGTAGSVVSAASGGVGVVDGRSGLLPVTDDLERSSLDYYATLRSIMAQRRARLVTEGKVGAVAGEKELPDLDPTGVSAK